MFRSNSFEKESELDDWLNNIEGSVEIVGYSAYGVGDVRNHQEFTAGVFVTVRVTK